MLGCFSKYVKLYKQNCLFNWFCSKNRLFSWIDHFIFKQNFENVDDLFFPGNGKEGD